MNHRLIVFVGEHWPQPASADWVALDARGLVAASGRSEPQHWPPAQHCAAVLGGTQCLWLEVTLPPAPRREQTRLLSYALEERLMRDPDSQHLVVTHSRPAESGEGRQTGVLAISRARLRLIQAAFETLGRPLEQAWSVLQGMPASASGWTLATTPEAAMVLRAGTDSAYVLDAVDELPSLADSLQPYIEQAQRDGRAPAGLALHMAAPQGEADASALEERLGIAVEVSPPAAWWTPPGRVADLLSGEFAPRQRSGRWLGRLRAPLLVAVAASAVWAAVAVVDVLVGRSEHSALTARMSRVLADTLPGTPAVAPALQLRRALDDARHAHGQLAAEDLLSLFSAHVQAGGSVPNGLEYERGVLRLDVPADVPPALVERLSAAGVEARVEGRRVMLEAVR